MVSCHSGAWPRRMGKRTMLSILLALHWLQAILGDVGNSLPNGHGGSCCISWGDRAELVASVWFSPDPVCLVPREAGGHTGRPRTSADAVARVTAADTIPTTTEVGAAWSRKETGKMSETGQGLTRSWGMDSGNGDCNGCNGGTSEFGNTCCLQNLLLVSEQGDESSNWQWARAFRHGVCKGIDS